jgi:DNA-binding NtrC family response regulator
MTDSDNNDSTTQTIARSLAILVAEFEASLVKKAIRDSGGNQARAARLLGIEANTLHYKIKRFRPMGLWDSELRLGAETTNCDEPNTDVER